MTTETTETPEDQATAALGVLIEQIGDGLHRISAHLADGRQALADTAEADARRRAQAPGMVKFFRDASSTFDTWTKAPTVEQQAWMRDHYHRMRVYSPYFDTRTSWFPDGLVYQDSYAIYVGSPLAQAHPEWILRDDKGEPLFIPFGAKPYKQYAADITNPAFRAYWIAAARDKLAHAYRGVFIDDVNYYRRVATATGDEKGVQVSAAGQLTDTLWRQAMANFMAEIRHALPDAEIVHNVVWVVPETIEVSYGLRQADVLEIERGVNDTGITGGTGRFALRSLLAWIDRRHAAGGNVVFDSQAKSDAEREYGLACYFLVSDGGDMLGSREGGTPGDWWPGYDTVLGQPSGPRERRTDGLLHRAFEFGEVYVNEPGASLVTVAGRDLGPASGAVVPNNGVQVIGP